MIWQEQPKADVDARAAIRQALREAFFAIGFTDSLCDDLSDVAYGAVQPYLATPERDARLRAEGGREELLGLLKDLNQNAFGGKS